MNVANAITTTAYNNNAMKLVMYFWTSSAVVGSSWVIFEKFILPTIIPSGISNSSWAE